MASYSTCGSQHRIKHKNGISHFLGVISFLLVSKTTFSNNRECESRVGQHREDKKTKCGVILGEVKTDRKWFLFF